MGEKTSDTKRTCEEYFDDCPVPFNAHRLKVQLTGVAFMIMSAVTFGLVLPNCTDDSFFTGWISFFIFIAFGMAQLAVHDYFTKQINAFGVVVSRWMKGTGVPSLNILSKYQNKTTLKSVILAFARYGVVYGVVVCLGVHWAMHHGFVFFMYLAVQISIVWMFIELEYMWQVCYCSDIIANMGEMLHGITEDKKYTYYDKNNQKRTHYAKK
ncbi:MAG: hypothetical protein ACOVQN_00835 [Exiguobacterium sp.]